MTQRRGAFIVLEGLDRSGKSTQVQRLYDRMLRQGKKVSMCRFPGELDDRGDHQMFCERVQRRRREDRMKCI